MLLSCSYSFPCCNNKCCDNSKKIIGIIISGKFMKYLLFVFVQVLESYTEF